MPDSGLVISPTVRVVDASIAAVAGGSIEFYSAGTSTPKTVYSDRGLSSSLGATVYLDSAGHTVASQGSSTKVLVYTGSALIKMIVKDADGVTLATYDNVQCAIDTSSFTTGAGGTAGMVQSIVSKTSDYTVLEADLGKLFNCDPTGGQFTMTLPNAATMGDGFEIGFRHSGEASNNAVLLRPVSNQTVQQEGSSSKGSMLTGPGEIIWLTSNGGNWIVTSYTAPGLPYHFFAVEDRTNTPPTSPDPGACYLINATPTGDWATLGFTAKDIVRSNGQGGWIQYKPTEDCSWVVYVKDEELNAQYQGTAWVDWDNLTAPSQKPLRYISGTDTYTAGTAATALTVAAWQAVAFNTQTANTITTANGAPGNATYNTSSGVVTLPTGTYFLQFRVRLKPTYASATLYTVYGRIRNSANVTVLQHDIKVVGGSSSVLESKELTVTGIVTVAGASESYLMEVYPVLATSKGYEAGGGSVEQWGDFQVIDMSAQQGPRGAAGPASLIGEVVIGSTYTFDALDIGKIKVFSDSSQIAATLPQTTTTGFGAGWYTFVQNYGTGLLVITPTVSLINNATSLNVPAGEGVVIASDGTNYQICSGMTYQPNRLWVEDYAGWNTNAAGNDAAIAAAIADAATLDGAEIHFPPGSFDIAAAITVSSDNIKLIAPYGGQFMHDYSGQSWATRLKWTGSSTGDPTMITLTAVSGASSKALVGCGVDGLYLDGNLLAGQGVDVASAKRSVINNCMFTNFNAASGKAALRATVVATLGGGEARDTQYCEFNNLAFRLVSGQGDANAILLTGDTGANTSYCRGYNWIIQHHNQDAIVIQNGDMNAFSTVNCYSTGTGKGLRLKSHASDANQVARWNEFDVLFTNGGVVVEGTETNPQVSHNNSIRRYDLTNGSATPSVGTGASLWWEPESVRRITRIGDANYTITSSDYIVAPNSLTAAHTYTLPAAANVAAGWRITVADIQGVVTATNTITVQRAGSDVIAGGTTTVLNTAYASITLESDGSSRWTIVAINSISGAGDVTAASAFGTDNRVIRSDGTGKGVQVSAVTIDDSGNITLPSQVLVTADTTATQITADQNNYNPTGLSTTTVLRISSDAARNITGIAGGSDGRILILENVGSFSITLKHNSGSSSAGNKISGAYATDVIIPTGGTLALLYDTTASLWVCLGGWQVQTEQIAAANVTFAKMQNIATDRLIGRDTAGSGSPEEISLNATLEWTGAGGIQRAALTGDVTASAGSNATTIANAAVTLAKMANIATDSLIGRDTASSGVPEVISVSGGLEFTGSGGIQRSALTGDVTASAGSNTTTIAASAVTNSKASFTWTAYTPTVTPGSGSYTTVTATGRHCKVGSIVHWEAEVTYTNIGTGGISTTISLPFTSAQRGRIEGQERGATGIFMQGEFAGSATGVAIRRYDAVVYVPASGDILHIGGFYEV